MIIGVGHVARTGKDTFASALVDNHGFDRIAFADAVRHVVYDSDPDVRRYVDLFGWEAAKERPGVRRTLVDVGIACRRRIGEDVWIRALEAQLRPGQDYVIPDVRFPNEVEWLKSVGGIAVRIDRPGVEALPNVADQALVGFDGWDYIVPNTGTVDELAPRAGVVVGA